MTPIASQSSTQERICNSKAFAAVIHQQVCSWLQYCCRKLSSFCRYFIYFGAAPTPFAWWPSCEQYCFVFRNRWCSGKPFSNPGSSLLWPVLRALDVFCWMKLLLFSFKPRLSFTSASCQCHRFGPQTHTVAAGGRLEPLLCTCAFFESVLAAVGFRFAFLFL